MSAGARRAVRRGALATVLLGMTLTTLTALPLLVASSLGATAPAAVAVAHVAAAALLMAGLAAKLGAGRRRPPPLRTWSAFVARLGLALGGYAALTGVLRLADPAWADQHLAGSFWATAVIVVHLRQRWGMARRLMAPGARPSADYSGSGMVPGPHTRHHARAAPPGRTPCRST